MNPTQQFIKDILLEVSIDKNVENGMFEIGNPVHMEVLIDHLFANRYSDEFVNELVNNLAVSEGKYPDRQAFNKEGWLVTFPSADYRMAAIKRGTHFTTDPTKGRGGMNLYYKKRGKQKHQTQQPVSATDPVQPGQAPAPAPVDPNAPVAPAGQQPAAGGEVPPPAAPAGAAPAAPAAGAPQKAVEPAADPSTDSELPPADGEEPSAKGGAKPATAAPEVPTPAAPAAPKVNVADLTKQFALEKGWTSTPYGDWNDKTGKKVAVVSIGLEVVPLEHVEREALKAFVNKKSKV